jgi:hypothetical protein
MAVTVVEAVSGITQGGGGGGGGGGEGAGFAVEAVQSDENLVSITSTANNGSAVTGKYVFDATSNNANFATSQFVYEANAVNTFANTDKNHAAFDTFNLASVANNSQAQNTNFTVYSVEGLDASGASQGLGYRELNSVSVNYNSKVRSETLVTSLSSEFKHYMDNAHSTNVLSWIREYSLNDGTDSLAQINIKSENPSFFAAEATLQTALTGGVLSSTLSMSGDIVNWNLPTEVGAEAAPSYAAANAPAAGLTVTNFVKITLNGVEGYIPFLSV